MDKDALFQKATQIAYKHCDESWDAFVVEATEKANHPPPVKTDMYDTLRSKYMSKGIRCIKKCIKKVHAIVRKSRIVQKSKDGTVRKSGMEQLASAIRARLVGTANGADDILVIDRAMKLISELSKKNMKNFINRWAVSRVHVTMKVVGRNYEPFWRIDASISLKGIPVALFGGRQDHGILRCDSFKLTGESEDKNAFYTFASFLNALGKSTSYGDSYS